MCLERAALAEKDMEYWLAEAEEWRQLRETADPFVEGRVFPASGFTITEPDLGQV
jgi:hypothetical protein